MVRRPLLTTLAFAAAALAATPGSAHAQPMLGIADDLAFADSRPDARAAAFRTAREAGARVVRLTLDWSAVAPDGPSKPAGFDAADPGSPLYQWGYIEDAVRDAAALRLRVVLTVVRAPRWAEGLRRPSSARPGTWRPDPGEFRAFMRAAARRFSGFYPDPKLAGDGLTARGASLPRVRFWQVWDEPNRTTALRPASAGHYRTLLNAGAEGVRAVSIENRVVAGGTAARGATGFWGRLLCLGFGRCANRARFDVLAHHPVTDRRPISRRPLLVLARQLRAARDKGSVRGKPRKKIWLTDLAWPTPPLAPSGVSLRRQAANLRISLRRAAERPEVGLVLWEGLQDRRTYLPERFPTIASGLFGPAPGGDDRGVAKPALRAFQTALVRHAATSRRYGATR